MIIMIILIAIVIVVILITILIANHISNLATILILTIPDNSNSSITMLKLSYLRTLMTLAISN
jgi:hypothetical protein